MQIIYNFCKKFYEYIFAEFFPPNRNFGEAIVVQDLRGIHVWNSVQASPPPNQNPGAATDIY